MRGSNKHYLKDEPHHLLELVSTITRTRKDYKLFLLSNNLDLFMPYITYFNIPEFEKSYIDRNRGLYVEKCPTKEELLKLEEETPLYRWTQGTTYAEYHYNNKVLTKDRYEIIEKPRQTHLWYRLGYNDITLSFWIYWDKMHKEDYRVWIEKYDGLFDPNRLQLYVNDRHNKLIIQSYKQSVEYRDLLTMFFQGSCNFDRQETATIVTMLIDMLK